MRKSAVFATAIALLMTVGMRLVQAQPYPNGSDCIQWTDGPFPCTNDPGLQYCFGTEVLQTECQPGSCAIQYMFNCAGTNQYCGTGWYLQPELQKRTPKELTERQGQFGPALSVVRKLKQSRLSAAVKPSFCAISMK